MAKGHVKQASPDHPIEAAIADRFSPYAYDSRSVEAPKLLSCLEAARWAASSYNEQPWAFIVAQRDNAGEFQRALDCLLEANQAWAKHAPVLMLTVISRTFAKNGKPNRVAEHDLGLAMGNLCVQATVLGLHVHQMAGVNLTRVRQTYGIPDGWDPMTAAAIGYAADPDRFAEKELADRDRGPRSRKKLDQFVFEGGWSKPAPWVQGG